MDKLKNLKVSPDVFFKLVELKGKLKAETWDVMFLKIYEKFKTE